MVEEQHSFQAEVGRLLDIVAHSVYSDKRVFLRELISNAADACDRLRYAALTQPELTADGPTLGITLEVSKGAGTLTIADTGIGMSHDELIENLGTIARSGTAAFLKSLSGDARKDVALIGQFGIGFYSAFMVAEEVEVVSRKAGSPETWRWRSDGKGAFTIGPDARETRGTTVILHMKPDAAEFLEPHALRGIVRQYSDHVAIPIVLKGETEETLNRASALWTRPRSEVTPEQYAEFYRHVGHAADEPWLTAHWRAEGRIEYSALLFVPKTRPFDLFTPDARHGVRLYVRRVFITDTCEGLVPRYLRFLTGIIDSEDLPLNVSREMLQSNPVVEKIRAAVVKRVLSDIERKAKESPEDYLAFWEAFGAVIKEGLYADPDAREALLSLARFKSTGVSGLTDLAGYVERMKPGQEAIYTIAGDDAATIAASPHLEGFRKRGVEVLLLDDPIDEFWAPAVGMYKGKPFRSVTRGAADLSQIAEPEAEGKSEAEPPAALGGLVAFLKLGLKDEVKDVRLSQRLTDSPACLVADDTDLDLHLERLLRQHRQLDTVSKRILEINPTHPLVTGLAARLGREDGQARVQETAQLLLDLARIAEGEPPADRAAFARRVAAALERGL